MDLKEDNKSEKAMEWAVRTCCVMLPIITGPIVNPDAPGDDPRLNAYFSRPYCLKELRWAVDADVKKILPIVRHEDKMKIGILVGSAPEDLQGIIGGIDFVDLIRSDIDVRARVGGRRQHTAAVRNAWPPRPLPSSQRTQRIPTHTISPTLPPPPPPPVLERGHSQDLKALGGDRNLGRRRWWRWWGGV